MYVLCDSFIQQPFAMNEAGNPGNVVNYANLILSSSLFQQNSYL